jgi:hypothetical protein
LSLRGVTFRWWTCCNQFQGIWQDNHGSESEKGRWYFSTTLAFNDINPKTYELIERDLRTSSIEHEPPCISKHRRASHINPNNHVAEEQPLANKWLTAVSRW